MTNLPHDPQKSTTEQRREPATQETLVAGENYRKIRLLASGSFADVWQGEAPGKLPVAIKVIRQSIESSAGGREYEALERTIGLRHPFLVQMHAYWMDQEHQLNIVMELGDKTLHQRLNECKNDGLEGIPKEELIKYFRQAADALDYLHRLPKDSQHMPMVHQDVKPANILLFQGNAKLADFGVAEILPDTMRTIAGQGEGTAVYMAPDAFKREVHPNNDQYSLAATYVHLRLGRVLFPDLTYFGQMQAHLNQTPNLEPLREVEQRVLLKALHKDRKQRYGSCLEFITALDQALVPSTRFRSQSNKPILDHRIGPAGRGDIHEGFLPDDTTAAITVIHDLKPSELREMVRAAKLLKTIDHPNLVKVYDYWQIDRTGTLVSEDASDSAMIVGKVTLEVATEPLPETLEQRLEKSLKANRCGLEAMEVVAYLKQAAEALDFLNHRRTYPGEELSIQHCGLGPHCFYIIGDQLKLGDFSLVKILRGDSVTLDNIDLDPGWCPPEVFGTPPLVVRQSDQYRLAISYYLLRAGKLPFDKRRPHKVLDEGLDLSGLEDPEREIIARATAVRPHDRFPNCRVLMRALEESCTRRTAPAKPAPKPESKVQRAPEAPPTSRPELGTVAPPPQPPDASPPTSRPVRCTTAVPPQPPPVLPAPMTAIPPAPPSREAPPAAVLPPQLPEASPPPANPEAFVPGGSLRPVPRETARKERAPLSAEAPVDKAALPPAPDEEAEDLGVGLQESIWTQRPSLFETERRDHDKHIPAGLIETGPPSKEPPASEEEQESEQGWHEVAAPDAEPIAPRGRKLGLLRGVKALLAVIGALTGRREGARSVLERIIEQVPLPESIRRHTNVRFPARAPLGKICTLRIQLVPAEETQPSGDTQPLPLPHPHDATVTIRVPLPDRPDEPPPPIRLTVSVAAENFTIEGNRSADLVVPLEGKSPTLRFRLRADKIGPGRIMIDFMQHGRPVGSVDLYPEVVRRSLTSIFKIAAWPILLALPAVLGPVHAWEVAPRARPPQKLAASIFDTGAAVGYALGLLSLLCAAGLLWGVQRMRRSWQTARSEGELSVALSIPPLQPPDVVIKVFEHRCDARPGRLDFVLSSTHPKLQDLPVMDGDLGTQDLKSDVGDWVGNHLRTLGSTARRSEATTHEVDQALADVGCQLYEQLLPEKMQDLCWTLRQRGVRTILILSDEPHIPWELIKPYRADQVTGQIKEQDDFWGQAFAVTHWLRGRPPVQLLALRRVLAVAVGGEGPMANPAAPRDIDCLSAETTSTPAEALPLPAAIRFAQEELAILRALEKSGAWVQVLRARKLQLVEAFERGAFDVLHLACHGTFGGMAAADASALQMEDDIFSATELPPRLAGALRSAAPLIFFNACETGRLGFSLTRLGSWGARLVQLGCGGFVGALWPVTDKAALAFAREFYQELAKGSPLGEAVLQARLRVRKCHPNDPSWLAYCCFADPMARIANTANSN